jgi:tetratricopeptide (TPR) repeat protein
MMQKANEHFQSGALAEAEKIYRSIIEQDSNHAEAMFMLAQVRERLGDFQEAGELLEKVAKLEPFNPNISHAQGVLHINQSEFEEAERLFHQALDINPAHAAARNGLAFLELATGRFEAAEHSANQVLAEEPDNTQALTYMGTSLLEQGKVQEATAYLQESLRLDPSSATAQCQMGRALLAGGNAGFAMQCFENALQQTPGALDVLEYLGHAQYQNGMLEEAVENLRKAAAGGRANPELFKALATCEVALGNAVHAEALLAAALQMAPGREDLVIPYAEMLLARKNHQAAIDHLQALVDQGQVTKPEAWILLAQAYTQSGDLAQARSVIEPRVAVENPSPDLVLAWIQVLRAEGRVSEADTLLDELLESENVTFQARLFKARQLFRAEDDQCIGLLRELANEPDLRGTQAVVVRHMLADALHRVGNYEEAAKNYAAMANRHAEILSIDHELFEEGGEFPETAMNARVTSAWPNRPPVDGREEPVFVIAWPGSGQERVLAALDSHPAINLVLDHGAAQAERRSRVDRPRGASALNALDDTQVQLARGRYWKAMGDRGPSMDETVTIDGMWLTVESLPTIYRLFPEAKVLVIRRDPRDMAVTWMQSGYLSLDIMARAYGTQLAMLDLCRDTVPLQFIDLDYDQLEADPAAGFAGLLADLGLEPEEAVLERYAATPMPVTAVSGDWKHYKGLDDAAPVDELEPPTVH